MINLIHQLLKKDLLKHNLIFLNKEVENVAHFSDLKLIAKVLNLSFSLLVFYFKLIFLFYSKQSLILIP